MYLLVSVWLISHHKQRAEARLAVKAGDEIGPEVRTVLIVKGHAD
jgi:hypothetical protein